MEAIPIAQQVTVHPLVLLSVVDHYNRVAKGTKKRVVGVLLGNVRNGTVVEATNSFAVPFDEDLRDQSYFFLDQDYIDKMFSMYRKVNAREQIIGFYSSGPKIRPSDSDILALFQEYLTNPTMVIVDVRAMAEESTPTRAFQRVEDATDGEKTYTLKHVSSEIGAEEVEEVGVEHLLRDINDVTVGTLGERIRRKMYALRGFHSRIKEIHSYLSNVAEGKAEVNNQILHNVQRMITLMPNVATDEFQKAIREEVNDSHVVMLISSLLRAITSLHDLVNNKLKNQANEQEASSGKEKTDKTSEAEESGEKEENVKEKEDKEGKEESKDDMDV
eukprot:TRINITY_DN3186_c0_g1_i1.p1 TRINITY_DN3186_c0_g1~~TRINITY_DN3186_c0_g1_i1.p1  ORF type:complete len:360 (-),score=88.94 TRINITY_DN3186_c0_g1_i1:168-1160(-)